MEMSRCSVFSCSSSKDKRRWVDTGKSLSEALIFESTNPQYDDRLFIELHTSSIHENSKLKPGENMLCTEIVSDMFSPCSAKRRASDKDLPVKEFDL